MTYEKTKPDMLQAGIDAAASSYKDGRRTGFDAGHNLGIAETKAHYAPLVEAVTRLSDNARYIDKHYDQDWDEVDKALKARMIEIPEHIEKVDLLKAGVELALVRYHEGVADTEAKYKRLVEACEKHIQAMMELRGWCNDEIFHALKAVTDDV